MLVGGFLQFAVQAPAVRTLGFSLRPLWSGFANPQVKAVLLLMLPGIPVLGINQINQLVSNRFASFIDSGVSYTYGAYRVTELVFGAIVVQLTTVLLPLLSRELRQDPEHAPRTLVGTITLVSFVTLPAAVVMAVLSRPVIGLLFGGGRFDPVDVRVTGATLDRIRLFPGRHRPRQGHGHRVFCAEEHPHTDVGEPGCSDHLHGDLCRMVGPWGTVGLGWANTVAMACFGLFLTVLYGLRYGFRDAGRARARLRSAGSSHCGCRDGGGPRFAQPWLASIDHTSLDGARRLVGLLPWLRSPMSAW